jgi:hypothetical protein
MLTDRTLARGKGGIRKNGAPPRPRTIDASRCPVKLIGSSPLGLFMQMPCVMTDQHSSPLMGCMIEQHHRLKLINFASETALPTAEETE